MPTAAEVHDSMVSAYNEQRVRLLGQSPGTDAWSGRTAARFRDDPRRLLDPVLQEIASYLRPEDVLVDVGGGAGRLGLPLALRCRELINVDPSPGMRAVFEEIAQSADIRNVRFIQQDWLDADGVSGDVALVAHVTYFVPRIADFLAKFQRAITRRVVVNTYTTPPPNTTARMFELVNGEPQALVPGHDELLLVLEEMGIKPELRLLDPPRNERAGALTVIPDRGAAIEAALVGPWLRKGGESRARAIVESHFEELFSEVEGGYIRRPSVASQPVLITWEI